MPELYDVVASQTITVPVPPLGIRDVQEVTVRAKPSGITFPVQVQLPDMTAGNLKRILTPLATAFNDLGAYEGVADVQVEQDVKRDGQIVSVIVVTVQSDDGMQEQDLRLSWGQEFRGFGGFAAIDTVRNNLNAINDA